MPSESNENSYLLELPNLDALPSLPFEERLSLPSVGAVYFVRAATGALLYVGSTKNLRRRWFLHHRQHQFSEKQGVRIAWHMIDNAAHRTALEQYCLDRCYPLYQQAPMPRRRNKKGQETFTIVLRIPKPLYARLDEVGRDELRSVPNQILWILERLIRTGQLRRWAGVNGKSERWSTYSTKPSPQQNLF